MFAPVYLDHNATTPLDPAVRAAMLPWLEGLCGNASSRHEYGRQARAAVDLARQQVAAAVNAMLDAARTRPHDPERTAVPAREALPPLVRVLVAEDNVVNQRVVQGMLRARSCEVIVANNGREAVDAWQRSIFDVVFMDVQMPEMDGFEAVAAIRAAERTSGRPRVPIVALTAHAMTGDAERCLAAGMDGYLSKPLRRGALDEEMQRLGLDPAGMAEARSRPA